MPPINQLTAILKKTESYLTQTLLPFWIQRAPDPQAGGFLTYFDANGKPTGQTTKTFLMQIRMLYTMASAHRAGYGNGQCARLAHAGAQFILDHYWDDLHDGWFWVADRAGQPTCLDKIGYGQCFALYAFSEYFLATADPRGRDAALRTYDAIARHMIDVRHGGIIELCHQDWTPMSPGSAGGDRKSLDVHMHFVEALTNLYQMTGCASHRRRLTQTIDLILAKMLHPDLGLGFAQFTFDFTPLPAIIFDTTWGRDADPQHDQAAKPLDQTSPGHNVELAWLLLHAADVLHLPRQTYAHVLRNVCDHCITFGIDPEFGGVYADVPMDHPTQLTEKQFWQHAEVLIAMLDAVALLGDDKYWHAFTHVHDYIFDHFIAMHADGEWYERLGRRGNVLDGDLAHAWKISYHTVRSMIQTVRRLKALAQPPSAANPPTPT